MERSFSSVTAPLLQNHVPREASGDPTPINEVDPTQHGSDHDPFRKLSQAELGGQLPSTFCGSDSPEACTGDENEPYNMKELIEEKPEDVIQYLEEEGLQHLGSFEVPDYVVLAAFGSTSEILTVGCDQLEVGWEAMWRQKLSEATSTTLTGNLPAARAGWSQSYTLQAFVVNMADAAAEGHKGILRPLLLRYNARACPMSVFALPAVQAIIHYKWNHSARRYLLLELIAYALWLGAFTTFTVTVVHQGSMDSGSQWHTLEGLLCILSAFTSLTAMSYFLYMDACTFQSYKWGWLNFTNLADLISYVLQIVIFHLYFSHTRLDGSWLSILMATAHVLMWSKLHYYARVFNPTKNLFLDTVRIVLDDAKWFILFMLLTMAGFGFAFYALYRQDDFTDFNSVWHSQASMFAYMLAMFDYAVFYNSKNPVAAMVLFMVYNVIVTVLLVNVLIAIMTNALHKVSQDEGLRFLLYRAQIIDEIESTIPKWLRRGCKKRPTFVHLLRVSPESTYEPNLYSIWSGMGSLQTNIMDAQDEARGKLVVLEERVASLNRKVDLLTRMLLSTANGTTNSSPDARTNQSLDPTSLSGHAYWEAGLGASKPYTTRFKASARQLESRTTDDLDELLDSFPAMWDAKQKPRVAPTRQKSGTGCSPRKFGLRSQGSRKVASTHLRSFSCQTPANMSRREDGDGLGG